MKSKLTLLAGGVDIAQHCISFTYTDNAKDKADDLQATMRFGPWVPERKTKLKAKIELIDWPEPGQVAEIQFGEVSVDSREHAGLPMTTTVKAASTLHETKLAGEEKDKDWEDETLSTIVAEKADDNEMVSVYESEREVTFARLDQRNETDIAFLRRICRDVGFAVKVQDKQLIVYEEKILEARPPVANLDLTDCKAGFRLNEKTAGVFAGCQIDWLDPITKKINTYVYTDPKAENKTGRILKVTDKPVSNPIEAMTMAASALREANQHEYTAGLTLPGRPDLQAGLNVTLSGFGVEGYDNKKFFIEQAVHGITRSAGYTTQLTLRACLRY